MSNPTIADCTFLQYAKSCFLGGENMGVSPSHFEWESAPAQEARFVTDSFIKDARGEGQVAILLESFLLHPENYFLAAQKPFDYVLTHNQYFVDNFGWLWYPHGGSWVNLDSWGTREKTRSVSVLLSNKQTMPGHKLLHEIVGKFGDKVDVFGLQSYVEKKEALSRHMYSIVVEAEKSADFFSEKLLDCFAFGTVPIYWGCPGLDRFFDLQSVFEFKNLHDLEDIIKFANSPGGRKWYFHQREALVRNMEFAKKYRISEDWIFEHYPFLFNRRM